MKGTIGEISGLQTFFDLFDADSDLHFLMFKGITAERENQYQIPPGDGITSNCNNLHWADNTIIGIHTNPNYEINSQEANCRFNFDESTITAFELHSAYCNETTVCSQTYQPTYVKVTVYDE